MIGVLASGLVVVLCLCSVGIGGVLYLNLRNNPGTSASSAPGGDSVHTVTYSATSADGTIFEVDYYDDSGAVVTDDLRGSPWTDSETLDSDDISYITLDVHNNDVYDGTLTCSITVDGRRRSTATRPAVPSSPRSAAPLWTSPHSPYTPPCPHRRDACVGRTHRVDADKTGLLRVRKNRSEGGAGVRHLT
ncbi:hypothetical protein [Fodinicola feengrottensis]|uniref:hypothetical protein n=1 Tax=Fodinicola feengrottensis TaxID=435914 RepID=UPI0013D71432|nr:hypothetical protein [Fodinicola feengrottensis]